MEPVEAEVEHILVEEAELVEAEIIKPLEKRGQLGMVLAVPLAEGAELVEIMAEPEALPGRREETHLMVQGQEDKLVQEQLAVVAEEQWPQLAVPVVEAVGADSMEMLT
jgi:hypothetical protein